jgi:hypothetical protein
MEIPVKRSTAAFAVLASGCSLLFDGSDLRGGARDAGMDASRDAQAPPVDAGIDASFPDGGCAIPCGAGSCCVSGACVATDADGDGYPRAECAPSAAVADCEDNDRTIFPWPPRAPLTLSTHAEPGPVGQLDVLSLSPGCGLVAATSVALDRLVIDRVTGFGEGCGPVETFEPTELPCGEPAGFTTFDTVDLRGGDGLYLTMTGTCGAGVHMLILDLAGSARHDVALLRPAADIQLTPRVVGDVERAAYIARATFDVRLVTAEPGEETDFGTAADDWISATSNTMAVGQGDSIRLADIQDFVGSELIVGAPRGRAALIQLVGPTNLLIASRQAGSDTDLVLAGPFESIDDPIVTHEHAWAEGAQDPLFAGAAYATNRFILAGVRSSGVLVRLGHIIGGAMLEDGVLELPLAPGTLFTDIAIDARQEGDRVHAVVAVGAEELRSTRFTICLPPP